MSRSRRWLAERVHAHAAWRHRDAALLSLQLCLLLGLLLQSLLWWRGGVFGERLQLEGSLGG